MSSSNATRLVSIIAAVFLISAAACQAKGSTGTNPTAGPAASTPAAVPVDLPAARLDQAGDVNSMANANLKQVSGGDNFVNGLYERPFNAKTMDKYFPYLDITNLQGYKDDTWGYATITLAGADSNGALSGQYAVELDLNKDGRGDWLIRASSVTSPQWSRQGVQAWKDTDGDVGGHIPVVGDNNPQGGDGYETLVFDQGNGTLTDGAFARVKPDDPKTVEIAFLLSMLGNPSSYAMGAWAGTNIDPSMFDYNDHMTHAQAGSPNRGDSVYPLNQLAEIDNTCRLAIGFKPTTVIPGLCELPVQTAKGNDNGSSGCVSSPLAPCGKPGGPSIIPGSGIVQPAP